MLELALALLAAHVVADFLLQTDFMAEQKRLVGRASIGFHFLTAHAVIHGLTAGLVLEHLGHDPYVPAAVIAGTHWAIDFGKSWALPHQETWLHRLRTAGAEKNPSFDGPDGQRRHHVGFYGINVDQALHLGVLVAVAVAVG